MSTAGTALGQFAVSATRAEAKAFRAATGVFENADTLPATFPIRWLVSPDVRAAMIRVVDDPSLLLVHEAQSFAYSAALRVDRPYGLTLTARRESEPARLVVEGIVSEGDGVEVARLETILRLISAWREGAA